MPKTNLGCAAMLFQMDKNKTAYKILEILADGRFHSGQALGQALGITRSGIWKAMQQLQKMGLELHAVTGKGYRSPYAIDLLDSNIIRQSLQKNIDEKLDGLIVLTSVDSTNEYLLKHIKQQPLQTLACLSEYQTAGKGRADRSWVGGFASSLYLSLLWHFNTDPSEITGLSLAIGVAVIRALNTYGISHGLQLKWPNDILWKQKKLAGILIELVAVPPNACSVVIGIGLNANIPTQLGQQISQPWTDLLQITQQPPRRNFLAALILNELMQSLLHFEIAGLNAFIDEWLSYDCMIGKAITLTTPQERIHGIMQGISNKGGLIIQTHQNETRHLLVGEIESTSNLRLATNS